MKKYSELTAALTIAVIIGSVFFLTSCDKNSNAESMLEHTSAETTANAETDRKETAEINSINFIIELYNNEEIE